MHRGLRHPSCMRTRRESCGPRPLLRGFERSGSELYGDQQVYIGTADNRRRRVPPPPPRAAPPPPSDHRGKKRNLHQGKSDWAIFGTQTVGSQTPLSSNVSLGVMPLPIGNPPPPPPTLPLGGVAGQMPKKLCVSKTALHFRASLVNFILSPEQHFSDVGVGLFGLG